MRDTRLPGKSLQVAMKRPTLRQEHWTVRLLFVLALLSMAAHGVMYLKVPELDPRATLRVPPESKDPVERQRRALIISLNTSSKLMDRVWQQRTANLRWRAMSGLRQSFLMALILGYVWWRVPWKQLAGTAERSA